MNKFYAHLLLCSFLTISSSNLVFAQNACPAGPAPVASAVNADNAFCVVYVKNVWPDALVMVLDANLQPIGSGYADATGFASIEYPCGQTPYMVSSCVSGVGCCNVLVPPQAFLPMKLTGFTAHITRDNSVQLTWTSEIELSSFKYVVQKSNDAKTFTDIGDVKAAGNSDKLTRYSFSDINFNGGTSYFRLKQVDIDGKVEYSRVVYVNNKKSLLLVKSVAPNPFSSDIQLIGISSSEVISKHIRVYSAFGQTIGYRITGANSIAIDAGAPPGIYYLRVREQTFKLFKN